MDELIFELTQPLKGTGSDMLVNFAVRCFAPAALLTVLIALESECFSANGMLNGGLVLSGTTWTMGGLFAQTLGMPLKLELGENMIET